MAVRTEAELKQQIATLFADNMAGNISEADLRSVCEDIADTMAYRASLPTPTDGSYERTIFRASVSAPSTPAAPNNVSAGANPTLPSGWSATPPTTDTPIWASFQRVSRGSTTVAYTAPRRWDGADGAPGGGGGAIADNSITPAKAQADTTARQKAWRERLASAHIGSGSNLPDVADTNVGDVWIFPQAAIGLSWRDISDLSTEITDADSGDVGLFLPRVGWTRIGNLFERVGHEALEAAGLNAQQIAKLQDYTADLHKVVDEIVVTAAPAADMGLTGLLQSSAQGRALINNAPPHSFDGSTLPGGTSWAQAVQLGAQSLLLIRLKTGLERTRYQVLVNGNDTEKIAASSYRGTDGTWDYYLGILATDATSAVAQRRAVRFHTTFEGELAGRALEQLPQGNQWPGQVYVDQGIPLSGAAVTLRVRLVTRDGQYPVGARGRIEIAGQTGAAASLAGDITHPLIATASRNLVNNHAAEGYAEAFLSIVPSDSLDVLQRFPIRVPIVNDGKWRTLTGASPYILRRTDEEIIVWAAHNASGGGFTSAPVLFPVKLTRGILTNAEQRFIVEANPPDPLNNWCAIGATLASTGTQLTLRVIGNDIIGYTIHRVQAR